MSKVLAVNTGSSSLKFQLYEMPQEEVLTSGIVERIGLEMGSFTIKFADQKVSVEVPVADHSVAVQLVLDAFAEHHIVNDLNEIIACGHRIVQGGAYFDQSILVDEDVIAKVEELADLAPLHNPSHLVGYRAFKAALPMASHTFVFDTAFHQTMSEEVFLYPLPYSYYTDYKVRRYGAHGTSHQYVSQRTAELMGKDIKDLNIITLHLGNGASITAIKGGKCINTSMGLTPLDGVMMGTRSGSIDPAIVGYLSSKLDKTAQEIVDILNKESGMLGISGISSDARDIENAIEAGNPRAILTRKIYARRIMEVVGSYAMQLGHVDALAFAGGLGENDVDTRSAVLDLLIEGLGVDYDRALNSKSRGKELKLSTPASKVEVWICPTNEELVIARDSYRLNSSIR